MTQQRTPPTRRRVRRGALGWASLLLLVGILVPGAASGQDLAEVEDELERLEGRQESLQERLDAATRSLADAEAAEAVAETRTRRLEQEAAELTESIEQSDARTTARLRAVYMTGSLDPLVVLLGGDGPGDAVERALTVEMLVSSDRMSREAAEVSQVELDVTRQRLDEAAEEAADAAGRREQAVASLEADLAELAETAEELERDRERLEEAERRRAAEEAERRRAAQQAANASSSGGGGGGGSSTAPPSSAPPPAPSGGMACPVDSPRSFTDTWGAPRSGGRSHRGTDIIAPRGNPVRAIVAGTWDIQRPGANAGLWAILRGNDGNEYWYLHLDSHVAGDGQGVGVGQLVGTNGDTGNARGTTPHVHFELHIGGSSPVNPYTALRRACG